MLAKTDPWYKEGLPFECTGCGMCCTGGPGAVWVSDKEVARIAEHLELSPVEFMKKYTRLIDGRRSLNEDPKTYDCVFLKENKCSLYHLRPKQCRTYPFWPQHLKSKKAWDEASKWCEGMNPSAKRVPLEEIEKQLHSHLSEDDSK
jgi:hypothetical protein